MFPGCPSQPPTLTLLPEPGHVHERTLWTGSSPTSQGHQPADSQREGAHGGAVHAAEQGKQQLLDTWMEKDRKKAEPLQQPQPPPPPFFPPRPPPRTALTFPGGSLWLLGSPSHATTLPPGQGASHPPGPGALGLETWKNRLCRTAFLHLFYFVLFCFLLFLHKTILQGSCYA